MLRNHPLQSHQAGMAEQVRADLALFEVAREDSVNAARSDARLFGNRGITLMSEARNFLMRGGSVICGMAGLLKEGAISSFGFPGPCSCANRVRSAQEFLDVWLCESGRWKNICAVRIESVRASLSSSVECSAA